MLQGLVKTIRKALHPAKESADRGRQRSSLLSPWQRCLLVIGSCGYVGYLPASGTVSVALVGIPVYYFLLSKLPNELYAGIVVAFTLLSVWIHDRGDRILGEKDSGKLVFDELVGFFIAMAFFPVVSWQLLVAAFFLERGLDVLKVWPANVLEKRVPGGWGVVLDDVVAGLYTCGILHLLRAYSPSWLGL